ncbi:asparagine synthetase B family protein [Bacillus sp. P14.5]|uniref:asparagine synthase family protein n=1 Tax=Bacillus sp. P14.5 TaxID=1983400 RepID=UPI000DEA74D3|nr:asparagine synthetase B family protein [Bacillus sp. P14.5]
MNIRVEVKNDHLIKSTATNRGNVYFAGYVYYKNSLYDEKNIRDLIQQTENEEFQKILLDLRGEFVLVIHNEDEFLGAVDRKRSIPLYYYKENNGWVVTDKISSQGNDKLTGTAVTEFIITGFTTNDKTLYEGVKQVEAGCYITEGTTSLEMHRYYSFYHAPLPDDIELLSQELESVLLDVFRDLSERTKNKTIVLPLSGGYDSRIIALLLKKFGNDNIIAFTYGKRQNKEAGVSEEIAKTLNIPWEFYEYKKEDWYSWYQSDKWNEYVEFAVNGSNLAHLQDWPAVTQLVQKHSEELVFIPGHSGDFIAGSHLPFEITEDREFSIDEVISFILNKHYKLWDIGTIPENGPDLVEEIKESIQHLPYKSNEEASALFEYWDWKERQAKFIINSLRVYEFYQESWEIPLWDDRIMEFFKKVPVSLRFNKYLYDYTLHRMYPSFFAKPKKLYGRDASLSKKYGKLYGMGKKVYQKKKLWQQYYKDPMEWYGIFPDYKSYLLALRFRIDGLTYKNPYNINSFLVKDFILKNRRVTPK